MENIYNDEYDYKRLQKYAQLVSQYDGNYLLDIGCNVGKIRDYLPKSIEYYGVDVAYEEENIKKFNLNHGLIPFENYKFDFILCAEILEHLYHPMNVIKQIPLLLKKGGKIIISLPNENTIFHRIMVLLGKGITSWEKNGDKHIYYPTVGQNREFVRKYFKIIKEDYYITLSGNGSRMEWLGRITKHIPYKLALKITSLFPSLLARGIIFVCELYGA